MPARETPSGWRPHLEVDEWFYGLASEWARCLRAEASPAKATTALVRAHSGSTREGPERAIFWRMLAYYQCRDECLQPLVRRRALEAIRRGSESVFWLDGSPSTPARRRKDYGRIRARIEATPRA